MALTISNQKTVTNAGTSVILGTEPCVAVIIKALPGNTGSIYVQPGGTGGSNYSSTGFVLSAKESIVIPVNGIASEIAIDSSANNEGVSYIASKVSPINPSR